MITKHVHQELMRKKKKKVVTECAQSYKKYKEISLPRVVVCKFSDVSVSCAGATVSVIAGNEGGKLNEPLFMGTRTSGCDNSQRGASEGVLPATFTSPLSVNLPVHLSVCHTVLRGLTNSIHAKTRVGCNAR